MKEFLNKKVYLEIMANNEKLFFNGIVNSITDQHISFTDKFGANFMFRLSNVIQIKEKKRCENE